MAAEASLDWRLTDLSTADDPEAAGRLRAAAPAAEPFDLHQGPLLRAEVVRSGVRPRPSRPSYRAAVTEFEVPASLAGALRRLAQPDPTAPAAEPPRSARQQTTSSFDEPG
ncbi:MAG: hypothetical protein IRY85_06825 [Micromonosporaceae bacterium]|nr:hypothetical protein [Micromonosporaceae bacterium]